MMAFQNDFIALVIGPNGKPLRESSVQGTRTVRMPFNSEYKIRLKNNSKLRCMAEVEIDGSNVSTSRFILTAGQSLDLERFVEELDGGKRFKFVSVDQAKWTGELQDPTSPLNGFVKVSFYPEKTSSFLKWISDQNQDWFKPGYQGGCVGGSAIGIFPHGIQSYGGMGTAQTCINGSPGVAGGPLTLNASSGVVSAVNCATGAGSNTTFATNTATNITLTAATVSPVGGTAEGSDSNQKFTAASGFETESSPTQITLRILGPAPAEPSPWQITFDRLGDAHVRHKGYDLGSMTATIQGGFVSLSIPIELCSIGK